ncbi:S41 family peptidase [Aquimarina gracilis]|uniref:S41 family peptidase n=1 Tax=Aquimarina gracilis TaxID=874422 RepID=A0ABU5ZVC7_9FLAO|nr:S41 family peptidase [Aquimarina gracilis]MEB3345891.1 S41 family peptidase [Aquimarina gracilis]
MKKETVRLGILLFSFLFIIACSSEDDTPETDSGTNGDGTTDPIEIDNPDQGIDTFIWSGMNAAYLYKSDISSLANDRFSDDQELFEYLSKFGSPESLFDALTSSQDRFSFIVDDYVALEQSFSGVSKSNGMSFSLFAVSSSSNNVLGFVRYVLPSTDAATKGLERGMFFNSVDGVKMTRSSDFNAMFSPDSYTINLVDFDGVNVTATGQEVTLTQVEYTENPIFIAKTLDHNGKKIGYLMYNSFVGDFDEQLNDAFGKFKTDGIEDLILDLRYNGGGLVRSAIDLASMITGQFNGEIFLKEIWNDELQAQFSSGPDGEEALINRFRNKIYTDAPINSLNLPRLFVLTTSRTASASELIINGLDPYIDVIQIGGTTTGKFQASVTLYDGEGFSRDNASPDHTYAIQPLVFKSANRDNVSDYVDGLTPEVSVQEDLQNLGTLGKPTETFLKAALDYIDGQTTATASSKSSSADVDLINWESTALLPNYQKMYIDNIKVPLLKRTLEEAKK